MSRGDDDVTFLSDHVHRHSFVHGLRKNAACPTCRRLYLFFLRTQEIEKASWCFGSEDRKRLTHIARYVRILWGV